LRARAEADGERLTLRARPRGSSPWHIRSLEHRDITR
jgi:hypothetical protein